MNENGFGNYWIDGLDQLWSDDDQEQALLEGWRVAVLKRREGNLVFIEAYEGQGNKRPRFSHNGAALAHVESKSDQCSPLHEKAIVCLMAARLRGD